MGVFSSWNENTPTWGYFRKFLPRNFAENFWALKIQSTIKNWKTLFIIEKSMDNNSKPPQPRQLPDDEAVYIPDELFHSFRSIFEMLKEAQNELHKIREEMKPVEWFKS